ncbi:hypothetical protein [Lewinella sp. JB7]|uniref:hypothetical protein n=1 Tax=Lewinella sp. JB7 TaxID=2962887 RepID=UPI0020CA137D|nr:hypothetical protein [Lewinella sp. JB7]MCP9236376.1 hypothetical protein [Lewinella sp. JB7]
MPARLHSLIARLRLGWQLRGLRWRRLRLPLPPSTVRTRRWDRFFQWLDLCLVFDFYEACTSLCSPSIRPLTGGEIYTLRTVFGNSIPYELMRVDERAHLGPRQYRFLYVSFHTVNSWGPVSTPTLVHEAVHVWQYVHRGAIYIPRALAAQRSAMRYNYGGLNALAGAERLEDFNYEQMADLVEDAFRLANGYPAQWVRGRTAKVLHYYYPYLEELRDFALPRPYRNPAEYRDVGHER